ncbi:MAG: hypothetical protein NZ518_02050 [Dehalococcoidia bacterium]|nr:hypothetical protein [Dehalococcoidia bacterium]
MSRALLLPIIVALSLIACAPERRPVEILARDAPVHLGDQTVNAPPWRSLYRFGLPANRFAAEFYLTDPSGSWTLVLEAMQPNDWGNVARLNGVLVAPQGVPARASDLAVYWTVVRWPAPPGALRRGLNVLTIESAPRIPHLQRATNAWDDWQIRAIRLEPADTPVD